MQLSHLGEPVQDNALCFSVPPTRAHVCTRAHTLLCPLTVSASAQTKGSSAAGLPKPCSLHAAPVKPCSCFLHLPFSQLSHSPVTLQRVPELRVRASFLCRSVLLPLPTAQGRSPQAVRSCFNHAALNNQFC